MIKGYTDIKQSKILAEILPIESADMFFCNDGSVKLMWEHLKNIPVTTPCWSLSALLDILHDYTLQNNSDGSVFVVCDSKKPMISDSYKNPIDACVEMIMRLNKQNML